MNVNISEVIAVLGRTPGTLHAMLADLPLVWLETNEGEDTFSPRDVVGHLIHGEKTDWMPRIKLILAKGETQIFMPFDPVGFREAIIGQSVSDLLAEFESLRVSNVRALEKLAITPAQLELKGRHPELGSVSLGQLLATWVVHDLNHIGQVVRVMSKRYSSAVGPWTAYLDILNR